VTAVSIACECRPGNGRRHGIARKPDFAIIRVMAVAVAIARRDAGKTFEWLDRAWPAVRPPSHACSTIRSCYAARAIRASPRSR